MTAPSTSQSVSSAQKPPLTFEFTKRKRWADLLITELVDVIIFILSPSCKVLYCGTAVTELLGYRDADLVECDLTDFINIDDQASFRRSFEASLSTNVEMLSYVRLKCESSSMSYSNSSPQKEVLFEIKGYPHFLEDEPEMPKCFFAFAKPYPSKNNAMLSTFLELKMENERLQQRVMDLRSRVPMQPPPPQSASQSHPGSMYATSSMQSLRPSGSSSSQRMMDSGSYYTTSSLAPGMYDDGGAGSSMSTFDGMYGGGAGAGGFYAANTEEEAEEGSKKKKLKKAHAVEQYVCVTCGRTDSPEWRKGPLGPKTLCNACGLRWAKQMRKTDDPAEGGAAAAAENPSSAT
ncbi:hypothetical protein BDQ12DRAFT_719341 [Crucibulum laeve]|uniref:Uncharacterized protein n=1 Tax=Crucibulum laeve TaxID=68775 RepID=A0A5C3MB49_9AGAR|nr:hypothetical protein BDQ12DRAFT_719341 [Crucibulum laeve]